MVFLGGRINHLKAWLLWDKLTFPCSSLINIRNLIYQVFIASIKEPTDRNVINPPGGLEFQPGGVITILSINEIANSRFIFIAAYK